MSGYNVFQYKIPYLMSYSKILSFCVFSPDFQLKKNVLTPLPNKILVITSLNYATFGSLRGNRPVENYTIYIVNIKMNTLIALDLISSSLPLATQFPLILLIHPET